MKQLIGATAPSSERTTWSMVIVSGARDFGDLYGKGINTARGIASSSPSIGPNRTMVVVRAPSRTALNTRMTSLARRRATRAKPG